MNRNILTLLLLAGTGNLLVGCQSGPYVGGPEWAPGQPYVVHRASGEITMDAKPHPEQWARAMVIKDFRIPVSGELAGEQTQMRMLYDDKCLYVHFIAHDRDLRGTFKGKTDPIWSEDAVEVFLQPDLKGASYYEFEVNPINGLLALAIADGKKGTLAERADWTHHVRSSARVLGTVNKPEDRDQRFVAILAIPFADLEFAAHRTPKAGEVWRFIGARCNQGAQFPERADGRAGQELSACVPLPKVDFHLSPAYPSMKFSD